MKQEEQEEDKRRHYLKMDFNKIEFNKTQTVWDDLGIVSEPKEVYDSFMEYIHNVPLIRSLVSKDRKRAKDIDRDAEGKIVIDLTKPHILEDMDYFRPSAKHYEETGRYTDLRPNSNPNSAFGKWIREERRRCLYGYVRESDGEWITGDYYFFLNYCPIQLIKKDSKGKSMRVLGFPRVWDGHYMVSHYLQQARDNGHHAMMLAKRGAGKSFFGASMLAKRFVLGESFEVKEKVQCVVTAAEKKYITGANQILDMFQYYIDFIANNTQWPNKRTTNSLHDMQWTMGYVDVNTGTKKGTQNSVIGITSKDDESKLRGSRGVLYLLEESGSFPRLKKLYQVLRPSVEDGNSTFGLIFAYGTAGDSDSDFGSMQQMMYEPDGNNIQSIDNIFDKEGQGKRKFACFFPAYMNREECYDENGNSDVTKALFEICKDRYIIKHNNSDINAITKRTAEYPITPQEAIIRTKRSIFPTTELIERLNQIDNNPTCLSDIYVGDLVWKNDKVEWRPGSDHPIREFPTKDNKVIGALEIMKMPETDSGGKVPQGRYIIGVDPFDDDTANTMSLGSIFCLDLWTDQIAAEYTGRPLYADDFFEIVRKMSFFYNAMVLYESNKKGIFAYFSRMNCLYKLADTPEYLRDKMLIKDIGYGNKGKGVNMTAGVKNYGFELLRNWLLKPVVKIETTQDGNEVEVSQYNLYKIRNRALIQELISWVPGVNVDRIMAMLQVMIYREEKMVLFGGNLKGETKIEDDPSDDEFFKRNYKGHW